MSLDSGAQHAMHLLLLCAMIAVHRHVKTIASTLSRLCISNLGLNGTGISLHTVARSAFASGVGFKPLAAVTLHRQSL